MKLFFLFALLAVACLGDDHIKPGDGITLGPKFTLPNGFWGPSTKILTTTTTTTTTALTTTHAPKTSPSDPPKTKKPTLPTSTRSTTLTTLTTPHSTAHFTSKATASTTRTNFITTKTTPSQVSTTAAVSTQIYPVRPKALFNWVFLAKILGGVAGGIAFVSVTTVVAVVIYRKWNLRRRRSPTPPYIAMERLESRVPILNLSEGDRIDPTPSEMGDLPHPYPSLSVPNPQEGAVNHASTLEDSDSPV